MCYRQITALKMLLIEDIFGKSAEYIIQTGWNMLRLAHFKLENVF
jgi:hypothetical protein